MKGQCAFVIYIHKESYTEALADPDPEDTRIEADRAQRVRVSHGAYWRGGRTQRCCHGDRKGEQVGGYFHPHQNIQTP